VLLTLKSPPFLYREMDYERHGFLMRWLHASRLDCGILSRIRSYSLRRRRENWLRADQVVRQAERWQPIRVSGPNSMSSSCNG